MRKRWLGLAAFLVSGGAVQAQYPTPYRLPQGPVNYPAPVSPVSRPGYGYPQSGYAPQAQFQPIPGYAPMPAGPYAPAMGGHRPPVAGVPMGGVPMGGMPGMPGPAYPRPPLPASPTVPMMDPASQGAHGPIEDVNWVYHRPHNETLWFRADFTQTWVTPGPLGVPLITLGAATDPFPGALNPANSGTILLFGGQNLDFGALGGFRFEGGIWLDGENTYSIDNIWTVWSPSNVKFAAGSDVNGSPIIARPIVSVNIPDERSILTSRPGSVAGTTSVTARTDLWGTELNARQHSYYWERVHAEKLIGFRTVALRESIRIEDNLTDLAGGFLTFNNAPLGAGDRLYEQDYFGVINQFYGFQVGGAVTYERDWFSLGLFSKIAVGVTDESTIVSGFTSVASPTLGNQTAIGGILTQVSNIGNRNRYAFGYLPEAGANFAFNLHRNVRFTTGYTFLLWNSVIRPGTMIDRGVNVGLPPGSTAYGVAGPARPSYVFSEETFISHTFNFGLEFHF